MEISSALAEDLQALTEALDPPRVDLAIQLRQLISDIRMTNPAYLGLTLTVVSRGEPFIIAAFEAGASRADVRSSAYLPLATLCDVEAGSAIVFYASAPGAFDDFVHEVSAALGLAAGVIDVDGHLGPTTLVDGLSAAARARRMNQALGILIERGFTPETARAELRRLGEQPGADPAAAASQILQRAADGDAMPPQPDR
ncbi:MAG TPA: hypothetical protein VHS54_13495 [Jatrophihabitans sp.]|nr:hypothetical protein [Jatrophihabitans sp.]